MRRQQIAHTNDQLVAQAADRYQLVAQAAVSDRHHMHITYIFFDDQFPLRNISLAQAQGSLSTPGAYIITDGRNICGIGYEGVSTKTPQKIITILAKKLFGLDIDVAPDQVNRAVTRPHNMCG